MAHIEEYQLNPKNDRELHVRYFDRNSDDDDADHSYPSERGLFYDDEAEEDDYSEESYP